MEKNTVCLLQEIQRAFYNPDFGQENWEVLRKKVDTALATYQPESPAPLSAEEIERLSEDYAESVISEDTTATYTAAQAYHHVKKAYKMALLSKRQPVAPEREEIMEAIYQELNTGGYGLSAKDAHRLTLKVGQIISPSAENKGASGSADGLSKKGGEE